MFKEWEGGGKTTNFFIYDHGRKEAKGRKKLEICEQSGGKPRCQGRRGDAVFASGSKRKSKKAPGRRIEQVATLGRGDGAAANGEDRRWGIT